MSAYRLPPVLFLLNDDRLHKALHPLEDTILSYIKLDTLLQFLSHIQLVRYQSLVNVLCSIGNHPTGKTHSVKLNSHP